MEEKMQDFFCGDGGKEVKKMYCFIFTYRGECKMLPTVVNWHGNYHLLRANIWC